MSEVLGKESFRIKYYDNPVWKEITADFEVYDSKYTYNIKDEVKLKNIDFERINLFKGNHHKFEITFHKLDTKGIRRLRMIQSRKIRFCPHRDSNAYYTVNCTMVKPFYIRNLYSTDGCKVVFETDRYQDIILKSGYYNVVECFSMDNLAGMGMNDGTLTMPINKSITAGLFGGCVQTPAGVDNYMQYANPLPLPGAGAVVFQTWVNIPFSTEVGSFFSIGDSGMTNFSLQLVKKAGWDSDGGGIECFIGGVSTGYHYMAAGQWQLITVAYFSNDFTVYLNNIMIGTLDTGTTPKSIAFLGTSSGYRPYIVKFDQTTVINIGYNPPAGFANYMYNEGKGRLVDMPKLYYP